MICLQVQDATRDYLKSKTISGIKPEDIYSGYDKGRVDGSADGEKDDDHQFFEPPLHRHYPMIVCDCPSATPPPQLVNHNTGTFVAIVNIILQVKVEDTTSQQFRNWCGELSDIIYARNNKFARGLKTNGLCVVDQVQYGQQSFEVIGDDNIWMAAFNIQFIAG